MPIAEKPTVEPTIEPVADSTSTPEPTETPNSTTAPDPEREAENSPEPEDEKPDYKAICNELFHKSPVNNKWDLKSMLCEISEDAYFFNPLGGKDNKEVNDLSYTDADYMEKIDHGTEMTYYFNTMKRHVQLFVNDDYYLVTGNIAYETDGEAPVDVAVLIKKEENGVYRPVYISKWDLDYSIKSVSGSSSYKANSKLGEKQENYLAKNVINLDNSKVWCPRTGKTIGEWLKIKLKKKKLIHGVAVVNGYCKTPYSYYHNRRVKKLKVVAGGVSTTKRVGETKGMKGKNKNDDRVKRYKYFLSEKACSMDSNDDPYTYINLPHPVKASEIILTIKDFIKSSWNSKKKKPGYKDIAITNVIVY